MPPGGQVDFLLRGLSKLGVYLNFASNPRELEQMIRAHQPTPLFIDEIQRIPSLLSTIQSIVDDMRGARKFFYPVQARENFGVGRQTYLKEEVQAEALTRNLEGFARFLFAAAAETTRFLDIAKLASHAKIQRHSAVRWFEILEDTLLVHRVSAFAKSSRKPLVQHPRYFFFDNGVLNALLKDFVPSVDRKGFLFENLFHRSHFITPKSPLITPRRSRRIFKRMPFGPTKTTPLANFEISAVQRLRAFAVMK